MPSLRLAKESMESEKDPIVLLQEEPALLRLSVCLSLCTQVKKQIWTYVVMKMIVHYMSVSVYTYNILLYYAILCICMYVCMYIYIYIYIYIYYPHPHALMLSTRSFMFDEQKAAVQGLEFGDSRPGIL